MKDTCTGGVHNCKERLGELNLLEEKRTFEVVCMNCSLPDLTSVSSLAGLSCSRCGEKTLAYMTVSSVKDGTSHDYPKTWQRHEAALIVFFVALAKATLIVWSVLATVFIAVEVIRFLDL